MGCRLLVKTELKTPFCTAAEAPPGFFQILDSRLQTRDIRQKRTWIETQKANAPVFAAPAVFLCLTMLTTKNNQILMNYTEMSGE